MVRKQHATSVVMCLAIGVGGSMLLGCTSGSGDPLEPLPNSGGPVVEGDYPDGLKGTQIGDVIGNFLFQGYVNARLGLGEDFQRQIAMGDFYNPTGEDVYGPGALHEEGTPKPKALFINVSAVWCGPCKEEAQTTLPSHYAELNPEGMDLLMVLADSESVGSPADFQNLDTWCTAFDVHYPAVVDPLAQLGGSFDQSQFPANFIIDTRTMEIVEVVSGIPGEAFFDKMDQVLATER
jgi:hypothetical protein